MPIHHGRCGPRGRAAGARWTGEAARPTQATLLARSPGAALGLGGFRACAGPFSSGRRSRARPGEARAQGATVSRHRPRRPGLRVPRLPAPLPGRVLRPLSTPSSNPHIARGRSERAATKEAGKSPRRGSSLSGAEGGARPALSAPPGSRKVGARPLLVFKPSCLRRPPCELGYAGLCTRRRPDGRGAAATRGRAGPRPRGSRQECSGTWGTRPRVATCSSPDDIWKESANGQSGVYFETANNDFSRVRRQRRRTRSGRF